MSLSNDNRKQKKASAMNILVASNDAYYPRLKVFTRTLDKHNHGKFVLHLLYSDLSQKNISDYLNYTKKVGIAVKLIPVSSERSNKYKLIHQITKETYYRFLILELFKEEDRVIWMDIDTVILRSIEPFYYQELENNYVAATAGNNVSSHLKRLNLSSDGCYFNAGIILFNLESIRKDFPEDFLYRAYEKHEEKIRFADQDVLNIVFDGKVKSQSDRRYNYIVMSGQKLSDNELSFVKNDVAIIHYIRHIKPWQICYDGKLKSCYLKAMFPLYPMKTAMLLVGFGLYKFKPNKKTLENSTK